MEWYKKYRPKTFADVLGQTEAVRVLEHKLETNTLPRTVFLLGPSGVGKTTLARIIVRKLGCSKYDFHEVNCAGVESAIDTARSIQQRMHLAPTAGSCRVWFLEEFQSLVKSGWSQEAMLKMLEDTPRHVYFILAASEGDKIKKAIHTRSMVIVLKPLDGKTMRTLLQKVADAENITLGSDVAKAIVEVADGSARKALVLLDQVSSLASEAEQVRMIQDGDAQRGAKDLAKVLMNPHATWDDARKTLLALKEEEPETVRLSVLGYAAGVLLNGNGKMANRAEIILNEFENDLFNSKFPGLVRATRAVLRSK